jgi:hypothetical protein
LFKISLFYHSQSLNAIFKIKYFEVIFLKGRRSEWLLHEQQPLFKWVLYTGEVTFIPQSQLKPEGMLKILSTELFWIADCT